MTDNQFAKLLALFYEIEALMVENGAKQKKSDGTPTSFSDKVKSFDNFELEPPNPGNIGYQFYFKEGTYHIKDEYEYDYGIDDELREYIKYKSYKKRYWEYKNNLLGGNFSRLKNIGHQRNQLLHVYNYNVGFYTKFVYECHRMIRFLKHYKKKTLFGLGKSYFEKDIDLKKNKISFIDRIRKIFYLLVINLVIMFLMVICIKAFKLLFEFNISTQIIFIIACVLFWASFLSVFGERPIRGFMSNRINRYVLVLATTLLLISTTSTFDFILDGEQEENERYYQEIVKLVETKYETISFLKTQFKKNQEYYRTEINKKIIDERNQIAAMNYLYYLNERNIAGINNGIHYKMSENLKKVYKLHKMMQIEYQVISDSDVNTQDLSLITLYKKRNPTNSKATNLSYALIKDDFSTLEPSSYMGNSLDYSTSKTLIFLKKTKDVSIPKIKDKELVVHKIVEPIKNVSTKLLKNKRLCKYFYVQTNKLNVRAKASSKANLVGKLHLNEKLCITKKDEDWYYIENQGWAHSKYLGEKKKVMKKKKQSIKKVKHVWHCSAKSERASGWVEKIGKKNAMNGALRQCEIRRVTMKKCIVDDCYIIN